ncbi:hypothetical protein CYMTET_48208 [Cymbomonas tetramitiformis]|uniref:Cytochrome P450 n=1 Tax=Cymbomonas tetramitiformis TaxID=36881 RepID=A0AAE0EWY6_9CHLO|nr:hypothetical protein CYMTET_48208 [Cymbomonas tetramitiformis]
MAELPGPGRGIALQVARIGRKWMANANKKMPEARGDIRIIIGEPVFVPLYRLYLAYGGIFRLSFGPKSFVVVSDNEAAKEVLLTKADSFSKGLLAEILDFVMGTGLIPADGEVWRIRRKALVPSIHKQYIAAMVDMFGESALHGCKTIEKAAAKGEKVEMENFFSKLGLDIIGKAVFNYDFNSLTNDDPVIQAVYTVLREAEYRSITILPYWKVPPLRWVVPRQRKVAKALDIINETLDRLVARCKKMVEEEDQEFMEEYLNKADPSILHFLIASGEEVSSKQLRDDLMTLLIAGHETTAAVLTWTFYLLSQHPEKMQRIQEEVDDVLGDRKPSFQDLRELAYTTRVINEGMRLYPQPPVLIRRTVQDVNIGGYELEAGTDMFISVWNLHRSPSLWARPDEFLPERFGMDSPLPNENTENFRYIPFGAGKRKCIGDQFALFQAVTALAMLARRFDFELAEDSPAVGMTTGATIHTTEGLFLTVTPRNREEEVNSNNAKATQRQVVVVPYETEKIKTSENPAETRSIKS